MRIPREKPQFLYLTGTRIILTAWLIASLVSACQTNPSSAEVDKWETFISQNYNFAIDYPANWKVYLEEDLRGRDDERVVVFVWREQLTGASIHVMHRSMESVSPETVAAWGKSRIESLYDSYELGELTSHELEEGPGPVLSRMYRANIEPPIVLQLKDFYIAQGNEAYIITLSTTDSRYADFVGVFDQAVQSFEITE